MHQYLGLSRTGVSAFYGNLACVVPTKKLFFYARFARNYACFIPRKFSESFASFLHSSLKIINRNVKEVAPFSAALGNGL